MRTRTILQTRLTIGEVQQMVTADYEDGDIVFVDDLRDLLQHHAIEGVLSFDSVLFLTCKVGKMQCKVKSTTVSIKENDMLCLAPHTQISDPLASPDFEASILLLSTKLLKSTFFADREVWNYFFYANHNPVIHLGIIRDDGNKLFDLYNQLLLYRMKQHTKVYNKEVMGSLIGAMLYDFLAALDPLLKTPDNSEPYSQSDIIFKRFVELLSSSFPRQRSVKYYAEKMCVTSKYLSSVVKEVSGKTAFQWINEYVIEDVKHYLATPNLTIKEIAMEMDFPSISFFGKYVKRNLGVSPSEYRKQSRQ